VNRLNQSTHFYFIGNVVDRQQNVRRAETKLASLTKLTVRTDELVKPLAGIGVAWRFPIAFSRTSGIKVRIVANAFGKL
jgi:hypothetical protein